MKESNLVIVESPGKIDKIKKALGSDYLVMASKGHIRDLDESGLSIDIANGFKPEYVVPADKKKLISDLKKAAKISGNKKIELVPVKELLPLTGYIRGGCSPIGMKKHYPTFFDETCILWDEIAVSAGERGHQILTAPDSLLNFIQGTSADLT